MILMLPLMGSVISNVFGGRLGEKGSIMLTSVLVGCSWVMSVYGFYEVGVCGNKVTGSYLKWLTVGGMDIGWSVKVDSLTVVMLLLVTFVSCMVHIYSSAYMGSDGELSRFASYLSLFTFFMLVLVMSGNYLVLFVGWEGIGVCSYLLISFWGSRLEANKAAIQAMLVNRIGDVGLVLGMVYIYKVYRSLEYDSIYNVSGVVGKELGWEIKVICILMLIGVLGKSAQIGLHVWLANAMEGPTPVSALIHAATLVTAGVFLLARSSLLYEYSGEVLWYVSLVGVCSIVLAGSIGLVQNDVKKVIAYSTMSQLGYMVFVCGISGYGFGIYHLLTHGCFKALLFLSSGNIIHGTMDEQDMRKMGGVLRLYPVTYVMILLGSLSLMGFPFLSGYYSKDSILEIAYVKGCMEGVWLYIFCCIGSVMTACYSVRLIYLVFYGVNRGSRITVESASEGGRSESFVFVMLGVGSVWLGYMCKDMFVGLGSDYWGNALYVHVVNNVLVEAEYLESGIKLIPTYCALLGVILGVLLSKYVDWRSSAILRRMHKVLYRKWYIDKVYIDVITQGVLKYGYEVTYKGVDKGMLELLGPRSVGRVSRVLWGGLKRSSSGSVYNYMLVMMVSIGILVLV